MALRQVKPGAAHEISDVFIDRPELLQYMPATTPGQRLWLRSVQYAQRQGGADYAAWVAWHVPKMSRDEVVHTVMDLKDWVLANYGRDGRQFVTRRFNPAIGLKAAIEASRQWHEAVASNMDCTEGGALPPAWYPAAKIGAFEIVPIETAADLVREGYEMHHCVSTYADRVREGGCYVYSVRRDGERVATMSVVRNAGDRMIWIEQVRGPCNAGVPKVVIAAAREWLRTRDTLAAIEWERP